MINNSSETHTHIFLKNEFKKNYLKENLIFKKNNEIDDYEFFRYLIVLLKGNQINLNIFFELLEEIIIESDEEDKNLIMFGFLESFFTGTSSLEKYGKFLKHETCKLLYEIFSIWKEKENIEILKKIEKNLNSL